MRSAVLGFVALVAFPGGVAAQSSVVRIDNDWEAYQHLVGEQTAVLMPWRDTSTLMELAEPPSFAVEITVNEQGEVVEVSANSSPIEYRAEVEAVARSLRFRPFERDGRPVGASFSFNVQAKSQDYTGPENRDFPTTVDLSTVVMHLQRTACFGTCAAYSVKITGDGAVTYSGAAYTLIAGEHHWTITRDEVNALVEAFRTADFFQLDGYYETPFTDLPTYVASLQIGSQRKFVLDYGGSGSLGEAFGSTSMGGRRVQMPAAVTDLENAIDRLSGAESWAFGDDRTIDALRAAGWDFQSPESGTAFAFAVDRCRVDLAKALLALGSPIAAADAALPPDSPAIVNAAGCGDLDLVNALIERGSLADSETASLFLEVSVQYGFPDLTALALEQAPTLVEELGGFQLLELAANAYPPYDGSAIASSYDPARVAELLIAAGADPIERGDGGRTALHVAGNAAVVHALVAAGADPMTVDDSGRTPLETVYSEEAALALIAEGAEIPSDRERLGALLQNALYNSWYSLVPDLSARAREIAAGNVPQ